MTTTLLPKELIHEFDSIVDLELLETLSDRKKFSKDFYDYSPVLEKQLAGCCAQLVVKPLSVNAVVDVVRVCKKYAIPLTIRGSGTGNYGQCVPLKGGVVMLMSDFSNIREFDSNTSSVTVEPGCLLRDLNRQLLSRGRQLRLLPSTWRSASVGGFISGGSGGIGSVRWGFLRDPGHLLGLEIVTAENPPRKLQLDLNESEPLNHAYGTNGIITALTLATAPAVSWQEILIDSKDWTSAVKLLQQINESAIDLFLCSLLEKKIVENISSFSSKKASHNLLLILVSPDGVSTLKNLADNYGANFIYLGPEDEKSGSGLRELSWNHTTLHMRAVDPQWTYLQMLLPQPEIVAMESLKKKWGDDLLWHIESVRQQGVQRLAALPLVRWRSRDALDELIEDCKNLGAFIFNPHVITVEDGGLGVIDIDQVEAKKRYDPNGILNPGKLKGWLNN
tara:strand:- start:2473 stop:3819 length:1347 start_codon:yes stop_codon:yes gene_type:complete